MKTLFRLVAAVAAVGWSLGGGAPSSQAYPPAPHHEIYGIIRDGLGTPLDTPAARVVLESAAGIEVLGTVVPDREDGLNYFISVPMDAGLTDDLYRPTAMRPQVPFKIRVEIGRAQYLPIEMSGDFARLGQPGQRTRLDLTLGEDADGDGLPDAWELALLSQMANGGSLVDIRPGDDLDGDGLSNLHEYLAGTYAYDRDQAFSLNVSKIEGGATTLEFLAIAGRAYGIEACEVLGQWAPVNFRVAGDSSAVGGWVSRDTRVVSVVVGPEALETGTHQFYRLLVR